jgi:WD40 repeat protein
VYATWRAWSSRPHTNRNLESFTREHARIFFGRGRAIRELYNLLTMPTAGAESRVIFYYGQTGVGKSSVLAAGLLPRVEALFATRYGRRSAQDGLLGTLREVLAASSKPFHLASAWLEIERCDNAKRPLLIVLDQAEEAFTRPQSDVRPKDEVRALLEAVREAFKPGRLEQPAGRLILSFRKEWLAEFNEIRKELGLDMKPKMLDPLDPSGVIEAIEGPAAHFELIIKPDRETVQPGQPTLAEFITHDLFDTLADPQTEQESPIAPTLQILLNRLWQEANSPRRLRGQPTFDRPLYQELKSKGFKLGDVIEEQFVKIAEVEGLHEAVEKGLLLDLLEFFTTREGTAEARTRRQVQTRYPHVTAPHLDALLQACQNCYLLADVGIGADDTAACRLTHDTLAPLIRERFRVSPALAQRARHLLEGRAATWKGKSTDPVLDRVDLASVEEGLCWMRTLEHEEADLLEASRQAELRRQAEEVDRQRMVREAREREEQARLDKEAETTLRLKEQEVANRRLRYRAYGLLAGLAATLLLAAVAARETWVANERSSFADAQKKKAEEAAKEEKKQADIARAEKQRAESRRLAMLSDLVREQRLDQAMLLAYEASTSSDTLDARGSVQRAIDARPEVSRFLHIPEGWISSVAVGRDGRIAVGFNGRRGGGVVLFDSSGRRLNLPALEVKEGTVSSVAFGTDGLIAAGFEGGDTMKRFGGVVLFDTRGERLRPTHLEVKEGKVSSVEFGTDGRTAVSYWGNDGGGVVLFDARGERLFPTPLKVREGYIRRVAFGNDGCIAAAYSSGVVVFDAEGKRVRTHPLEVKEGEVKSVAFGPVGNLAAGFGNRRGGGVVLFDPNGKRVRPAPLEVKEGQVRSVAIGSDGRICAGYFRGRLLFDVDKRFLPNPPQVNFDEPFDDSHWAIDSFITLNERIYSRVRDFGGVVLFDARGECLRPKALELKEGSPDCVAFGPGGCIAAGFRDGVVLFDARGERVGPRPLEVSEGSVQSVAFGPDAGIAVGFNEKRYDMNTDRHLLSGGVVLFDAPGKRVRLIPLNVSEGRVTSVAFDPEGHIAVGYLGGGGHTSEGLQKGICGMVLFDAGGERVRLIPLNVSEGLVTCVAFGPMGRVAAQFDHRFVVLFDSNGERLRPTPLEGPFAQSMAFGLDGRILVTYQDRVRHQRGVAVLDANPASWLRKLGEVVNRNFTRAEWADFFPDQAYRRTIRAFPWPHDLPEIERKEAEALEQVHPDARPSRYTEPGVNL